MEDSITIDLNTIEILFRNHYDELSRYAFSILKEQESAEDIVQKLFIKLWEKRNELGGINHVKAYLYQSVYNTCINELKVIKRKGTHSSITEQMNLKATDDASEKLRSEELLLKIDTAIERLPKKCGEVFKLSRTKEMTYKEISEQLNISIKTVENHMGKALKLMREELTEYLPIVLISILLLK